MEEVFHSCTSHSDEDSEEVRRIDYGNWDPENVEYHQFLQQYSRDSRNQSVTSSQDAGIPPDGPSSRTTDSNNNQASEHQEAVENRWSSKTRIDGYSNQKAVLRASESPQAASKDQKLLLDQSTRMTSLTFPSLSFRRKTRDRINPERRATLAVYEYHDAMKSISSGFHGGSSAMRNSSKCLFASPVSLYDGPMDSEVERERRDSHLSQGFVVSDDNINFTESNHHRALVTGGAGFIGSHLVKELLATGHSVVVLDNLLTGCLNNLADFINHPRFVFINHDITDPIPKRLVVDEVYHLACPSSPFFWQTNLINTFTIIVEGMRNVLDFAQKSGAKVLHASTTEIYGDPEAGVEIQSERYKGSVQCFTERASHDEAKRAAESLCYAYQVERKLIIRIARIGSTYGPRMGLCDGSMISSFTSALLEGVDIQIDEANNAMRTLMYVDDCVKGLIKLMNSKFTTPINIAGDDIISVKDLHVQLKALVANPSRAIPWKQVEFVPDPGSRRPANASAYANLTWSPEVKLEEGLQSTVMWFKLDKERRSEKRRKEAEARAVALRERDEYVKMKGEMGEKVDEDIPLMPLAKLFSRGDLKRGRTTGGIR